MKYVNQNTISTGFISITAKKVSLFYVLERNLFLQFGWFYFFINLKQLYESYLPLNKLFLFLFFNNLIWNQLSAATATVVAPVGSENGQSRKFFYEFDYFLFFDVHKVIVWVLLNIIFIIYNLIFQTSDAKSTRRWNCYSPCLRYIWSIFGILLGYWLLQKWDTGFEHRAIVCFVKRSEGDMVHTETVCFISS